MATMALPSSLSGEVAVQASLDRSPLAHLRRSPSPVHEEEMKKKSALVVESYHDSSSAELREHIRRHSSGVFAMEFDSSCENIVRADVGKNVKEDGLFLAEKFPNCGNSVTLNLSEKKVKLDVPEDPVLASLPPLTLPPVLNSTLTEEKEIHKDVDLIHKSNSSEVKASLLPPSTQKQLPANLGIPEEVFKVKGLLQQQLQLQQDSGNNTNLNVAQGLRMDDIAEADTLDNHLVTGAATPPLHLMDMMPLPEGKESLEAPPTLDPLDPGGGQHADRKKPKGIESTQRSTDGHERGRNSSYYANEQRQMPARTKVYSAIFGSLEHGSFPEATNFDNSRSSASHNSKAEKTGDVHRYSSGFSSHSPRNVVNLTQDLSENVKRKPKADDKEKLFSHGGASHEDTFAMQVKNPSRAERPPEVIAVPHPSIHEKQQVQSAMLHRSLHTTTITSKKKVHVDPAPTEVREFVRPSETFRPSSDAYTPRLKTAPTYKPAPERESVSTNSMGTISRPNFRDALRRVAMIIQQHVHKIERRFHDAPAAQQTTQQQALFLPSMAELFHEDAFITPRYKCTMVRVPTTISRVICVKKKIPVHYTVPTEGEIYEFAHQLFKTVQLSSECSIVCLIYIERLMEVAKVPLLSTTWRPIFMAGLLLASKVWQDLSSWNVEFASVYPQYGLEAINRLELLFLRMCKWDLYISSSLYAKYYFALRSLLEKQDFRRRYNRMVGGVGQVDAKEALKIQQRTEVVKEEALLGLSRSM